MGYSPSGCKELDTIEPLTPYNKSRPRPSEYLVMCMHGVVNDLSCDIVVIYITG